jgi:hypothetical protein
MSVLGRQVMEEDEKRCIQATLLLWVRQKIR